MRQKNIAYLKLFKITSNNVLPIMIFEQLIIFVLTIAIAASISKFLSSVGTFCENTARSRPLPHQEHKESTGERLMYAASFARRT